MTVGQINNITNFLNTQGIHIAKIEIICSSLVQLSIQTKIEGVIQLFEVAFCFKLQRSFFWLNDNSENDWKNNSAALAGLQLLSENHQAILYITNTWRYLYINGRFN